MIIGLTGTICAGKGTVAEYLKGKGFECYIYSDILREEAKKRKYSESREDLQKVGNEIRAEYKDGGYLSKLIIKKIQSDKAVADGVRNPDEIRELRKEKNFYLMGIDAPQKLRFQRLTSRKREGDPKTFEDFKDIDDVENKGDSFGQNINECLKMANYIIINDGSLEELKKKVEDILAGLGAS